MQRWREETELGSVRVKIQKPLGWLSFGSEEKGFAEDAA